MLVLFTLVTGVLFPLAFTAAGALALPFQSGGSLIEHNGKIIGSALLGQDFEAPIFSRPPVGTDGRRPER